MNTDIARTKMIEQQVRAWDVFDPDVLNVMTIVPREQFVPEGFEMLAFADTEIPIGYGESMMTPTIEGRVLQALSLEGSESVLEIGTGTGHLTACLAKLAHEVTSVDIHAAFLDGAAGRLESQGIDNVTLQTMDATDTLPEGQFDAIAITGSIPSFDPRYVDALAPQGRLFVIVGEGPVMDARRVVKTSDSDWESESLFETRQKALLNCALPPEFRF